jgi:CRISPR-associated endonuclease/helicase Cas3
MSFIAHVRAADNPDTRRELDEARAAAPAELLARGSVPDLRNVPGGSKGFALWVRMLFSCIVDADFLDTESFMDGTLTEARLGYPALAGLAARFDAYMAEVTVMALDSPVNRLRAEVLAQCRSRAQG